MKNEIKYIQSELKKKTAVIEIGTLSSLILLWLGVWAFTAIQEEKFLDRGLDLLENINTITDAPACPDLLDGMHCSIMDSPAFINSMKGTPENSTVLRERLSHSPRGIEWLGNGEINGKDWVAWRKYGDKTRFIRISQTDLLKITGFTQYNRSVMVCAGLGSLLLIGFMVWSLAWLRMTAVQQVIGNNRS